MFTLFDLMMLIGAIAGLVTGVLLGKPYGPWAAVAGAGVGVFIGYYVGRIPWGISWLWMRRHLSQSTTSQLRARIGTEYYISHLIIAELLTRGEPVESFRGVIEDQLNSDSPEVRRFGEHNARMWLSEGEEAG